MPSRTPGVTATSKGEHAGTPGELPCTVENAVGTHPDPIGTHPDPIGTHPGGVGTRPGWLAHALPAFQSFIERLKGGPPSLHLPQVKRPKPQSPNPRRFSARSGGVRVLPACVERRDLGRLNAAGKARPGNGFPILPSAPCESLASLRAAPQGPRCIARSDRGREGPAPCEAAPDRSLLRLGQRSS